MGNSYLKLSMFPVHLPSDCPDRHTVQDILFTKRIHRQLYTFNITAGAAASIIKLFRLFCHWGPHKAFVTSYFGQEFIVCADFVHRQSQQTRFILWKQLACYQRGSGSRTRFNPASSNPSATILCFPDFNGVISFGSPETSCFSLLICLLSVSCKLLQIEEKPMFGHFAAFNFPASLVIQMHEW